MSSPEYSEWHYAPTFQAGMTGCGLAAGKLRRTPMLNDVTCPDCIMSEGYVAQNMESLLTQPPKPLELAEKTMASAIARSEDEDCIKSMLDTDMYEKGD